MIQIRLLGPIDALIDGEATELGGRRQRRLLLRLILAEGRAVTESQLVDSIWDESDALPSNPSNTVQQYVSRLRTILGSDTIVTTATGYAIDRSVTTDIAEFEQDYEAARVLIGRGDLLAGHERVIRANERWRGPVFGDLGDTATSRFEATRLAELRISALELAAQARLDASDVAGALANAEALTVEHPLREAPVRTLALARRRSGQTAGAIRAIADFRRRLAEETGLEPSAELVHLERELLSNEALPNTTARHQLRGYELNELIAQGAFGSVYRATQPSIDREVAIKVVRPELANNPQFIRRFEVEAQMIARLEHPHIVPLHDYWREPGGAYLVMRYLRGGSAEQRLVSHGPLSLAEMSKLVDEIGGALALAHDVGVVHRDVKPANIIFDENDNAYLADFGIAIADGDAAELDLRSAGSPLYVSPEQIRHGEAVFASDIYAFGVVIFELLTGTTPFPNASSIADLLDRKLTVRLPMASSIRPDIPGTIDAVIQHATEPLADDRFANMGEMILAFRAAAAGHLAGASTTGATGADRVDGTMSPSVVERPRAQAARTLVTLEWQGTNPYKGLAAFQEADSADFFGRSELTDRLWDHLMSSPFLAVVGPSGSGKSSAVRAGLIPKCRDAGLFVAQMVPGEHPMHELETALLRIAVDPIPSLLDQLNADAHGLARAVKRCLPESAGEMLLVIDQFEELYTMTSEQERRDFLASLAAAVADPHGRLRIAVTLRADFYDRPLTSADVGHLFDHDTIAVTPLSAEELERAIIGPAERVGASVEPALVDVIINDVNSAPGALPLVQFALTETFERRSGSLMTLDSYRELGGVRGALARRADEVHDASSEAERHDLRRLFTRLIAPGDGTEDTRRRVRLTDLPAIDPAVVEACGTARLLSFDRDQATREPTVEVAHEALIREWSRLRGWLDDDRDGLRMLRHLDAAAHDWDLAGRPSAELYRGGRLEAIEEWAPDHAGDLSRRERDFLEASVAQRAATEAAEHKTKRRLQRLLAGVAIVAAMALIASGLAFQQRAQASANADEATSQAERAAANEALAEQRAGEAEEARGLAETAAFDAETGRLVATAESLVATNPRAALLAAVVAHQREETPATLGALQTALSQSGPLLGHLQWGTEYLDVEWLTDDWVVGISATSVDLFDVSTGKRTSSIDIDPAVVPGDYVPSAVIADASSTRVVVATAHSTVAIFDLVERALLSSNEVALDAAAVSVAAAEGGQFAAADVDNRVTGFDAGGSRLFSTDVDDSASWADQVAPTLGPQAGPFFANQQVVAALYADDAGIVVMCGSIVWRFGWNGGEVGPPSVMAYEVSDEIASSGLYPATAIGVAAIDDRFIDLTGQRALARVDRTAPWPATIRVELIDGNETSGATGSLAMGVASGHIVHVRGDGALALFEPSSGERTNLIDIDLGTASSMAVAPSGDRVIIAHDQGLSLVSTAGGSPIAQALPRDPLSNTLSISTNGSFVALAPGGFPGPATFWRRAADRFAPVDIGEQRDITFALIPIGVDLFDVLTSESDPATDDVLIEVTRRDADTFQPLYVDRSFIGGSVGDDSLVRRMTALGQQAPVRVQVFDWDTLESIAELPAPTGGENTALTSTTFDPLGDRLLVADAEGHTQLYDAHSWQPIDLPILRTEDIAVARWSHDGSLVATSSAIGTVSIRNGETFELIRTMTGATGTANAWGTGSLLFSADNRLLLTNHDGPGRLWDVDSGEQIGQEIPNLAGSNSGANIGDELHLVTAGPESALIWNLNVDEWEDIACRTAGSELTESEWQQWGPRDEEPRALCGGSL